MSKDIAKSQSGEIVCLSGYVVVKVGRRLGGNVAETTAKFHSDLEPWTSKYRDVSIVNEIIWRTVLSDVETAFSVDKISGKSWGSILSWRFRVRPDAAAPGILRDI